MNKKKIIDKIHKCLRLSESGNPNEAASALRQAQAMMRKFGICEEDVHSAQVNEVSADSAGYFNPPYWAVALSELVAQAFDCRAYISRKEEQRPCFRFIGVDYTASVAAYTFTVLFRQLRRARRIHMEELAIEDRQESLRRGNVFAQAWLFNIARTVAEFLSNPASQVAIDAYVKEHYGNPEDFEREFTDPSSADYDDILSGMRAARKVSLFRPVNREEEINKLHKACV
jgi:hypothetical protein